MCAIHKGQGLGPDQIGVAQWAVKMREQRAAAGWLPSQVALHRGFVIGKEHQTLGADKVLCGRFAHLIGSREVDIPIGLVNRSAGRCAVGLQSRPFLGPEDFIDHFSDVPWARG